jgi:hypothetical protein
MLFISRCLKIYEYCSLVKNEKKLQDNQKDLESATETLSEYLERDITQENMADIKQKVQDKYRYAQVEASLYLIHTPPPHGLASYSHGRRTQHFCNVK